MCMCNLNSIDFNLHAAYLMDPSRTNPINSFNLRANPTRPGIGSWRSDATWTRNKFQSVLSSRILSGTQPNPIWALRARPNSVRKFGLVALIYILKVSKTQKHIVKPRILPKNEQMNSTLLLWYHRLTCFRSIFGRNRRHQKTILKLSDL